MTNVTTLFIGLDTAKEYSEVAYSSEQRNHTPTLSTRIRSTKQGVTKMARHFQSKYPKARLIFIYEAGPCGYWIYRLLTQLGHACVVVAPSLIPKKPGARIKTDKRDGSYRGHPPNPWQLSRTPTQPLTKYQQSTNIQILYTSTAKDWP